MGNVEKLKISGGNYGLFRGQRDDSRFRAINSR